jgi:hypothetical protein
MPREMVFTRWSCCGRRPLLWLLPHLGLGVQDGATLAPLLFYLKPCERARCPAQVREAWGDGLHLVIAGLTNTYASYITTPEEYAAQRYEGGFTLYGQHTLDAYIQVRAARLAEQHWWNLSTIGPLTRKHDAGGTVDDCVLHS